MGKAQTDVEALPHLPLTGRRGWETSLPGFPCVARSHFQFGGSDILVRNSLFSNVPTLSPSGLQTRFWDDRPISAPTNPKQRTTNLPGRRGSESSVPASVIDGRRHFGKRYILGQNSLFSNVPTLIPSSLQTNFWDDRPIFRGTKVESVTDVLTAPTNNERRTTNHEQNQHFRSFPGSMHYLAGER